MKTPPPYAPALIRLLQGPVYASGGKTWDLVFRHRAAIEDYFAQLGLELVVAEHDGLAFLRRVREGDGAEEAAALPELTVRRELPYVASLLCVLLTEELYRFESAGGGESRLVLDKEKLRGLIAPYLPTKTNEAKQADAVDAQVNNLVRYGFLRRLGDKAEELEVTKLLKYRIDAAKIAEIKEKLISYAGRQDA